ncbi:hypothetical protein F5Y14DRAFT_446951 [Nemania sp. NC0429]|nr:hypothetical protein F5Y14DRAFT_446951 [Nemania sp. NC0429]
MADVAVREQPIIWKILPPRDIKINEIFTVVARIEGHVDPVVYEACPVPSVDGIAAEKVRGTCTHTLRGFNSDITRSTYVWFNIQCRAIGKHRFQFKISWDDGRHLYGGSNTFSTRGHEDYASPLYSSRDQDLLALLEPSLYDPVPFEPMEEE